jgi:hypothetical protein
VKEEEDTDETIFGADVQSKAILSIIDAKGREVFVIDP